MVKERFHILMEQLLLEILLQDSKMAWVNVLTGMDRAFHAKVNPIHKLKIFLVKIQKIFR